MGRELTKDKAEKRDVCRVWDGHGQSQEGNIECQPGKKKISSSGSDRKMDPPSVTKWV